MVIKIQQGTITDLIHRTEMKKKWGEKKRMNGTKVQMHMRNIKKKMVQMSNALKIPRGK